MEENKKSNPEEEVKYKKVPERDQFTVVLEQINSKLDNVLDHQQMADQKFDRFEADTKSSFGMLADYLVRIDTELVETQDEVKETRKDIKRIDTEIVGIHQDIKRIDTDLVGIHHELKKKDERLNTVEAESKNLRRLFAAKA